MCTHVNIYICAHTHAYTYIYAHNPCTQEAEIGGPGEFQSSDLAWAAWWDQIRELQESKGRGRRRAQCWCLFIVGYYSEKGWKVVVVFIPRWKSTSVMGCWLCPVSWYLLGWCVVSHDLWKISSVSAAALGFCAVRFASCQPWQLEQFNQSLFASWDLPFRRVWNESQPLQELKEVRGLL